MGRAERARWQGNDRATELVDESRIRDLTPEEIDEIKRGYTGYGGLTVSNGQFFTPSVITEFVVNLLGLEEGGTGDVLEPSCGAGAFLNAIPKSYSTTAIEMMNEASAVARLCFPHARVLQENTLEVLHELEGRFDYVIGNPPFMSMKHTPELVGFEVARFLGKAEWYFLELAFQALRPGGYCAFIVPDGILGNSKDQPGRKWLMESSWLRAVISLPRETFYHVGTTVKTSVLVFQKRLPGIDLGNYQILMGVANEIGWDGRGRPTGKCDLPEMLECWRAMKDQWTEKREQVDPEEQAAQADPGELVEVQLDLSSLQPEPATPPEPPHPEALPEPTPRPFYAIPITKKAKAFRVVDESMNLGFDFGGAA